MVVQLNFSQYDITNFSQFFALPNVSTGGWFWTAVVLLFFFVLYFNISRTNSTKASVLASSFIATLAALLLSFVGFVDFLLFVRFLVICAAGVWIFADLL
jgi:hypothetical protein